MTIRVPVTVATSMSAREIERLCELAADQVVLEVGSWLGRSTIEMAQVAELVYAVDWHRGDPHAGWDRTVHPFFDNLARYGVEDKVIALVGKSGVVLPALAWDSAMFGFHDAYHGRSEVYTDALLMARVVDGLISFHDYKDERFGVTSAVGDLVADGWSVYDETESLVTLRKAHP
jgi:hypothetical protein